MSLKDVIQLIRFEIQTNKQVNIEEIAVETGTIRKEGTTRLVSFDYSIKKAFALLGLYLGVVNAEAPSVVLDIIKVFIGG